MAPSIHLVINDFECHPCLPVNVQVAVWMFLIYFLRCKLIGKEGENHPAPIVVVCGLLNTQISFLYDGYERQRGGIDGNQLAEG